MVSHLSVVAAVLELLSNFAFVFKINIIKKYIICADNKGECCFFFVFVECFKFVGKFCKDNGRMRNSNVLALVVAFVLPVGFCNVKSSCKPCTTYDRKSPHSHYGASIAVEKSLLVKHLKEGTEHDNIFNTTHNNCEFSIVDQEPNNREYIRIDPTTKMITSIALDREDNSFSNMLVPQIQIQLELNCFTSFYEYDGMHNHTIPQRSFSSYGRNTNFPTKLGDRSYVLSRDIYFSSQTMWLTIIIEDENDNHPQFIYPPSSDFLIGYPEATLSENLLPDYLLKVHAVDKDDGLNSKIKYKISPNDHFDINAETGEIYPFENALWDTEEICLEVYATDLDGAETGKNTSIDIRVRKISTDHLALLTIESKSALEAERTLEIIKQKTRINFNVLRKGFQVKQPQNKFHSHVTEHTEIFEERRKNVILSAWIYGFDSGGKLLESSFLEEKMSKLRKTIRISITRHTKTKTNDTQTKENAGSDSITGLVITIILLLVIIIALIVSFIIWYCIRLHRHNRICTPSSSTATTISTISNDIYMQAHSPHVNNGNPFHHSVFHKRDSLVNASRHSILKGRSSLPEPMEINKFTEKLHNTLSDITEVNGSSAGLDNQKIPTEKRKSSVTFNDNIEFFNIDDDNDDQVFAENVRL